MAQLVNNLFAMRETWVLSLGWEDPLEKGNAIHSSILAWRIPWTHKESDTTEQLSLSAFFRVQLSHPYMTTGKNLKKKKHSFDYVDFCQQNNVSTF